jgi:predicted DNA-binding ribbon-helix-helix protein
LPAHVQPRKIIINGRPTSVRLEKPFWHLLRIIAFEQGMTVRKFIECVRLACPNDPLSSTLRIQVANYFYSQSPRVGYVDPHGRRAFSVAKPSASQRAEEAIRANPGKSDRVIAEEIGVSPDTVNRVRRTGSRSTAEDHYQRPSDVGASRETVLAFA